MKVYILLFIAVGLFGASVCAQDAPDTKTRVEAARRAPDRTLLIEFTESASPESRTEQITGVYSDGQAITYTHIKDWSFRGRQSAELNVEETEAIKSMLVDAVSQLSLMTGEKKENEKYTCLIFFDGLVYRRDCISGALSQETQNIIDFVKAIIKKRQKSIYDNKSADQRADETIEN